MRQRLAEAQTTTRRRCEGVMKKAIIGSLVAAVLIGAGLTASADGPGEANDPTKALIQIRAATARYLDIERAIADGYRQVTEMIPFEGYHFYNAAVKDFALAHPSVLLYVKDADGWQLVGVEYGVLGERPHHPPFPGARWQFAEAGCRYKEGGRLELAPAGVCPARHPQTGMQLSAWGAGYWRVRFWWYPSPYGLFADVNPYLSPFHPPQGPNPQRKAYSESSHFIAGVVVIVIGLLAMVEPLAGAWQGWVRLLWPGVLLASAPVLFIRNDPDAWPVGPLGFFESFADPEILLHRLEVFVILLIAAVELLRRLNRLSRPAWRYLFPTVATRGGLLLFVHIHDEVEIVFIQHIFQQVGDVVWLHLRDHIYMQHVGMGTVTLMAGLVKLLQESGRWKARYTAFVWPALIAILGLQLMVFTEG